MTSKKENKPFFAKFLEGMDQKKLPHVKGGAVTDKYPSDDDEWVTTKYPSDDDEWVTHKYPSDDDEPTPNVD